MKNVILLVYVKNYMAKIALIVESNNYNLKIKWEIIKLHDKKTVEKRVKNRKKHLLITFFC